ncbi:MAG: sulfotransferase family protein [Acidimicrobiia bacterium]
MSGRLTSHGRSRRDIPFLYLRSLVGSLRNRRLFDDVEAFVAFVGYERSGSTLLGSLLNAHRHAVISHELNVLRLLEWPFGREQIFSLILEREAQFGIRGRKSAGYQYSVPNQYQGRFERLQVLGDKRAAATSWQLRTDPSYVGRLRSIVRVPLRLIHTVRNPFDNISTMAARYGWTLDRAAEMYFRLCEGVAAARSMVTDQEWVEVRHEDLVANPPTTLMGVCDLLGLEIDDGYLTDCSSVVWPDRKKTRLDQPWSEALVGSVHESMAPYPWLNAYSFDD